jgi:hypothetical protein
LVNGRVIRSDTVLTLRTQTESKAASSAENENVAASDSDEEEGTVYHEEKYDDDPRSLPPCVKVIG